MSKANSAAASKRLMMEYRQLQRAGLVGANAVPTEDDIFRWKGLVICAAPYDFPIRFELHYDEGYPVSAPKAYFETFMQYNGGANEMVDGKLSVCLNIFGNYAHVHSDWKNDVGSGWSPAYTVETILVTMQALLTTMLAPSPDVAARARQAALDFKCTVTGHDGSDPEKYYPAIVLPEPTPATGVAEPATEQGMGSPDMSRAFSADSCVCYVQKGDAGEGEGKPAILGFGFDRKMASPCEFLSQDAFDVTNVRNSSTNVPFEFWIPMLSPGVHFTDIAQELSDRLGKMAEACKLAPILEKELEGFEGCPLGLTALHVLGGAVCHLFDDAHALSDRAASGFVALGSLLVALGTDHPGMVKLAGEKLRKFVQGDKETKEAVAKNPGLLMVYLALAPEVDTMAVVAAMTKDKARFSGNVASWAAESAAKPAAGGRKKKSKKAKPSSQVVTAVLCQLLFGPRGLLRGERADTGAAVPREVRKEVKGAFQAARKVGTWNAYCLWKVQRDGLVAMEDHDGACKAVVTLAAAKGQPRPNLGMTGALVYTLAKEGATVVLKGVDRMIDDAVELANDVTAVGGVAVVGVATAGTKDGKRDAILITFAARDAMEPTEDK